MTAACLDFTSLLAPITSHRATGNDIRQEDTLLPLYHKIKDGRAAARTIERQQRQGAEIHAKPDWRVVYTLALDILTNHTKDLEITAWLIEALLREHGFAGLRDGFHLAHRLIELYWEELYPLPDEDGLLARLAPLTGLNGEEIEGTLIAPIALVPLTEGKTAGPFALWQYQQALELLKIADPDKRAQREAAGVITLAKMQLALTESSPDFLQNQLTILRACLQEYETLGNIIEQKCGPDAVPSSRIIAQLRACIDCLETIGKEALMRPLAVPVTVETAPSSPPVADETIGLHATLTEGHTALTRGQVLQMLLQAAEFFRRTEPHSFIPYILERTVRWAKMPLPQLFQELIKEEQTLSQLTHLTGVSFDDKA